MRYFGAALMILTLPLLAACTGPKGDAGPMGASAPNTTPIYYYNNSFDTGGVSEWHTYVMGGGTIQTYLDNLMFVSPGQSLAVSCTGQVFSDSLAYIALNINPGLDCWTEFDWYILGATAGGFEFFEFMGGHTKNAVVGFNSANVYLVQGSTEEDIAPQPMGTSWHHMTIKVAGGSGKSSYWMDGLTLGTDYQTAQAGQGTPPNGYLIGIDVKAGMQSVTHIDNLKCYHY